jgi:protein-S-isoprenylcysteine O-methyltransferase Ste14
MRARRACRAQPCHSMMRTPIPPPLYAIPTAGVMWLLDRHFPQLRFSGALWIISGWSLTAIGIGLPLTAIIIFTRMGTTISPVHPDRARQLVMCGIFAVSRNPMYLGLVFSLAGWAVLLSSPICLLVVWGFARLLVIVQIVPEEIALRERFGDAYEQYTRHVNRWIGRRISLSRGTYPNGSSHR